MIPLVDTHCHLLAGLDDGPRSQEEALAMCRRAYADGIRIAAATAHQNEQYPAVNPDRIRQATAELKRSLEQASIPLSVVPNAEVMVDVETEASWSAGRLLSMGDGGQYLLVELPHGMFVDLRRTARGLRAKGIRPVVAHAERCPELLHHPDRIEELVLEGCLIQVSSGSVTAPPAWLDRGRLRDWFRRGLVHLLGSDAHSVNRRPPLMAAAYEQIVRWAGSAVADRVCSTNGTAVLTGLPLHVPLPKPRLRWFQRLWPSGA
jgi:protein-tyrosine phosphatase